MPNHLSPKKTLKQDVKRKARNKNLKSRAFNFSKKVLLCTTKSDIMEAFKLAQGTIMKTFSKGAAKKNNAARKISRLHHKVNVACAKLADNS